MPDVRTVILIAHRRMEKALLKLMQKERRVFENYRLLSTQETGEVIESYTMLTLNADHHPLMSRMHRPDPKLPADQQDKRGVIAIELENVDTWLRGSIDDATALMRVPSVDVIEAAPKE